MSNEFKLLKIESNKQLADLNIKFNTTEIFFNLRGKLCSSILGYNETLNVSQETHLHIILLYFQVYLN